jgi:hypothetical protein
MEVQLLFGVMGTLAVLAIHFLAVRSRSAPSENDARVQHDTARQDHAGEQKQQAAPYDPASDLEGTALGS